MKDEDLERIIRRACRENDPTVSVGQSAEETQSEIELEISEGFWRWYPPGIVISTESPAQYFTIDFVKTITPFVVEEHRTEYLTVSLYLVGDEEDLGPRQRNSAGAVIAKLDEINRDQPGVKFRFEPSDKEEVSGWVVIEADVLCNNALASNLIKAISRVLDCAEIHYEEVQQVFIHS